MRRFLDVDMFRIFSEPWTHPSLNRRFPRPSSSPTASLMTSYLEKCRPLSLYYRLWDLEIFRDLTLYRGYEFIFLTCKEYDCGKYEGICGQYEKECGKYEGYRAVTGTWKDSQISPSIKTIFCLHGMCGKYGGICRNMKK